MYVNGFTYIKQHGSRCTSRGDLNLRIPSVRYAWSALIYRMHWTVLCVAHILHNIMVHPVQVEIFYPWIYKKKLLKVNFFRIFFLEVSLLSGTKFLRIWKKGQLSSETSLWKTSLESSKPPNFCKCIVPIAKSAFDMEWLSNVHLLQRLLRYGRAFRSQWRQRFFRHTSFVFGLEEKLKMPHY